ncbi:hypothetical protein JCM6882_005407 [Rhodosporidiobolus microsporus]
MRPYVVIAAALAAAPMVFAQDAQVPVCVYTCITGAAALTSCASSDTACLCGANEFLTATVSCMEQSCDSDSLAYGINFGEQYCASAGVPVTLTGGSSTASAAASEAPSSIASEASSVAESAASAATSAASSASASQSAASSSAAASSSSASGSAPAASATGSGNGASTLAASSALALIGAGAALLL